MAHLRWKLCPMSAHYNRGRMRLTTFGCSTLGPRPHDGYRFSSRTAVTATPVYMWQQPPLDEGQRDWLEIAGCNAKSPELLSAFRSLQPKASTDLLHWATLCLGPCELCVGCERRTEDKSDMREIAWNILRGHRHLPVSIPHTNLISVQMYPEFFRFEDSPEGVYEAAEPLTPREHCCNCRFLFGFFPCSAGCNVFIARWCNKICSARDPAHKAFWVSQSSVSLFVWAARWTASRRGFSLIDNTYHWV